MADDLLPELVTGEEPFAELHLPHVASLRRRDAAEAFTAATNADPAQSIGCYVVEIMARLVVTRHPSPCFKVATATHQISPSVVPLTRKKTLSPIRHPKSRQWRKHASM